MEEILHAFGVDTRLVAIQIFNFLILIGVLWYFLYTPVLRILSEREQKIKKGVEDAVKAATALEEADAEKTTILKAAHTEAAHIVERGTKHAEEKEKAILAEAEEKAARELARAKESAAELKAATLKESEGEIAKMAILAAEKVLRSELTK
jgi:F-type H+-transporting ATPase subunit b